MPFVPASQLESRLEALLELATARARTLRRRVLISVIEPIATVDAVHAVTSVGERPGTDDAVAELLRAGRMVWAHRAGALALGGLGVAVAITATGDSRFQDVDGAWHELLSHAIVDGPDTLETVAGPILMGGFSFDAGGPRSAPWLGFGSAEFVVPSLLITQHGERTLLTVSLLVEPDGSPSSPPAQILHAARILTAPSTPLAHGGQAAPPLYDDLEPDDDWRDLVCDALEAIDAGSLQKVVVARAIQGATPSAINVAALIEQLRSSHRDAFVFGYWRGERVFLGASPERLVRLANGVIEASSLAGSAPRGASTQEDAALVAGMLNSAKDRAEHAMVRDALGEALAEFCDEVTSDDGPSVLSLPHVHHLYTAVRAILRPGHSLLDVAGALHPTPAVGGTPRAAALAFIREHERLDRGWYAGPVGWVGRARGEFAVALRSALVSGAEATLFAGCGIVAGSDPDRELEESRVKLRSMQSALAAVTAVSASPKEIQGLVT